MPTYYYTGALGIRECAPPAPKAAAPAPAKK
jgi:hypothetical protein